MVDGKTTIMSSRNSLSLPALAGLSSFFLLTACLTDNPPPRYPPPAEEEPAPAPAAKVEPPKPVAKTCPGGHRRAKDGLIDDLEDGDTRAAALDGRNGYWWVAKADNAVVTTPGDPFTSTDGGAEGSKKAVRFAGKTDHKDQWGAATGVNFLESGFYDASKYAGIGFRIKASKPNFNVRVKLPDASSHPDGGLCKAECWNSFGKELMVGTNWELVTLLWSDLAQQPDWGIPRPDSITPSKIKNVEWAVYPGVEFDISVDDLHFIECE